MRLFIANDWSRNDRHVAIKVSTADSFGAENPTYELDILRELSRGPKDHRGYKYVARLLDVFEHKGPNGNHVCLVFQAGGPDLDHYRMVFQNCRIPITIAKRMTKQLLLALSFLHDAKRVIHTGQ
jgi:serine/threonine-protein kinase SRPK3